MKTNINGVIEIENIPDNEIDSLMNDFIELVEKRGGTLFSTWVSSDSNSGVKDSPGSPLLQLRDKAE